MVSLDPEISNLLWIQVLSEAPSGSGWCSTYSNVPKEKWKTLDIQNGSKIELVIRLFSGLGGKETELSLDLEHGIWINIKHEKMHKAPTDSSVFWMYN